MHNLYVYYRVYSIHINYAYTMYNYGVIFQTSWFLHFEIVCHTSFNYYYYRPNAPFEVFDICLSKWICRGICFTDIYLPFRWMWSDFSITRMPWYEINPDCCVKFWNEFTSNKKKSCMVFLKDYHLLEFHFCEFLNTVYIKKIQDVGVWRCSATTGILWTVSEACLCSGQHVWNPRCLGNASANISKCCSRVEVSRVQQCIPYI